MRLTLRTMLAFLDDILEPNDSQELSQKIEESKFASDLVQRIRSSTRRLRLGAPKPVGKGIGLDPNTVAEYLDNTLPPEQVPEFEKVCLESDIHLAEVASCHQILTLVLGEPVEVEHAIRTRIYHLGQAGAQAATAAGPSRRGVAPARQAERAAPASADLSSLNLLDEEALSTDQRSPAAAGPAARSRRPAAGPGESRIPLGSLAITLGLAFLLAIVGLRAIGPFDQRHPVWRLVSSGQGEPAGEAVPAAPQVAGTPASEPETPPEAGTPAAAGGDAVAAAASEIEPASPAAESPAASDVEEPPAGAGDAEPSSSSADSPGEASPGATPTPVPGAGSPPTSELAASESTTSELATSSGPPSSAGSVGRYLSEDQVLARFDAGADSWLRLPANAPLEAGDELVVFPSYRPQILVKPGVKVTFAGSAHVRLESVAEGTQLQVQFGRFLLVPVGDEATAISLDLGDRQADLLLRQMESVAALDVRRYLPPGADPESTPPELVVRLYAVEGELSWDERGGSSQELSAGQWLAAAGAATPPLLPPSVPLPDWVAAQDLRPIELRASLELREDLTLERPLGLALLEQTEFERQHRVEVRALANRALVLLGMYDTTLECLNDPRQRAYWADHFAALRLALAQGPEAAARLLRMIDRLYGEEGTAVYRLLRGYSPDQLMAGGAEELVNALEHPAMSIRVLAFLNLAGITDMTHLYLPWQQPGQERDKVAKWRQSLRNGRIVYQSPPTPLPEIGSLRPLDGATGRP